MFSNVVSYWRSYNDRQDSRCLNGILHITTDKTVGFGWDSAYITTDKTVGFGWDSTYNDSQVGFGWDNGRQDRSI